MLKPVHVILAAAAFALVACGPKADGSRSLAEGEQQITGKVVRIEDGAYPMFFVHVVAPGQASELSLDLNAEAADLGGKSPGDFAGKDATVIYVVERKPNLIDLQLDGQSVLGDGAPAAPLAGASRVTGTLSGASAVSGGDLPDEITVTDAAGKATAFEYFIVPSMLVAEGKMVTAYYADDTQNRITAIRPVK
jgi:hypothetical protein